MRIKSNKPDMRHIVVKFTSTITRDFWLSCKRAKKELRCSDIKPEWPSSPVSINERATKDERQRVTEAKVLAKKYNFQYVWIKRGITYIRKDSNSRPIRYSSTQDFLNKIAQSSSAHTFHSTAATSRPHTAEERSSATTQSDHTMSPWHLTGIREADVTSALTNCLTDSPSLTVNWNFKEHVLQKCSAAHYRLKQVYPARHFLSTGSKLLLSHALILSLFNYVNTVFGPCISVRTAGRIQRIQNSCLRFSYGIRKYDHISPAMQLSGWLNMRQRWILHLCCITHKILHTDTPVYLRELSLLIFKCISHIPPAQDMLPTWQSLVTIQLNSEALSPMLPHIIITNCRGTLRPSNRSNISGSQRRSI